LKSFRLVERQYVISQLPALELLDDTVVLEKERAQAAAHNTPHHQHAPFGKGHAPPAQHHHHHHQQQHHPASASPLRASPVPAGHKRKREGPAGLGAATASAKGKRKKMISTTSSKENRKDIKLYCVCKTPYDESK
jgi:nucleosome-remodeling factor subunit BPTF